MSIAQTDEPTRQKPLRLWPGAVIVVLQWLVGFVVPRPTTFAAASSHVRREYLDGAEPALTVVIAGIYDESWLLEIEGIAYKSSDG